MNIINLELGRHINEYNEKEKEKWLSILNFLKTYSYGDVKRGYAIYKYEKGFVIYSSYLFSFGWRHNIYYSTDLDFLYKVEEHNRDDKKLTGEVIYDVAQKINIREMINRKTKELILC